MRLFISGSAPLLVETFDAWRERTGHTILERYGMSETVMLTQQPVRREQTASAAAARWAFRCPACGVRVRDDERRSRCPAGEIGGIEVKGPNVFAGYWRMPEKTAGRVHRRRLVQDRRRRQDRRATATSPSSAAART